MTLITQTPPQNFQAKPGAYFDKDSFNAVVWEHGLEVIHEIALLCPCKSDVSGHLSTCKNCGGTGWAFINPTETRMVCQGINAVTEYKDWSEKVRGMMKFTCLDYEQVAHMDRITVLKGNSIHGEVVQFSKKTVGPDTTTFAFTTYNIKEILYAGLFVDDSNKYIKLELTTDFTFDRNIIKIVNPAISIADVISITVRYKHAPQYHIIEMNREIMNQWKNHPGKDGIKLPVSGIGQRTHYLLDQENLVGDRILDNSYTVSNCP